MNMGLADKVVVVTGAASGIGAAIARQAAEEGIGALVLTDRDGPGCDRLAAALQGKADIAAVTADLTDAAAPAAIIAATTARFGRIDGLVNAAGLTTRGSVATGTVATWDQLFAVNARAGFFLMQAAIADMQAVVMGRGPGWLAESAAAMPLGRLVTEQEAARLAVFLLGEASVPMSGAVVDLEQKVAGAI
jgi:NAD(P)-dependent dehydrogenase (short-subunit alcohol dehydrogenase family)